jgi:acyl-CoA synthetase (AMP-forming)/AMP-acid ligase II/thioesterase domain-containing protein/acyl carrier protein
VDEQALVDLAVIDSDLIQRWEEQLQSLPEVEQVAVIIQDHQEKARSLHLSDLLIDFESRYASKNRDLEKLLVESASSDAVTFVQEVLKSKPLAMTSGEPLQLEANQPTTLSAALRRTALKTPEKGILYLQADGSEIKQLYKDLLKEAERILTGLRKLGLKPQDKVIFQINQNCDFIPAFWGCILGGFVPVPISTAPTYDAANTTVQKLHNAWQMLGQPLILTTTELEPAVRSLSHFFGQENFLVKTIDHLRVYEPDENWYVSQPDDLAVLFLTSGSTGTSKGVMLSHCNILSNVSASAQINGFTSDDISLNWLNLDHVGSLIRCSIRDIYVGSQQIHAPAQIVLEDPLKWLDWIDHYRVTFAWAPNFALGLVNAQAEAIQHRKWDLSAVKSLLSVAEAIVPKTAQRFWELLAPHGLSVDAMHSAWGMSETCAAVTFSHKYLVNLRSADYPFVEVGTPTPGLKLRIVDGQNQVVEEDTVGQLQIYGPMVTRSYYQNPTLNQVVFTEDGWFKTGDLGFLHQGRLTITGRQKDVIIINGLNHYSHEIEAAVETVKGVEVSYTAAVAVREIERDTDQLVIFFHTSIDEYSQLADLLKEIRGNVVRQFGVNPAYLIPVEKQTIPKTAIGKIQRLQLKQRFEAGEFAEILKKIDILSENANTLPDWFYRQIWRRHEAVTLTTQAKTGQFLIFLDELGLGLRLCTELEHLKVPYIIVETGSEFTQLDDNHYSLNPKNSEHYRLLLESVETASLPIEQILHLWTYHKYQGEVSSLEMLEQAQEHGVYSLLLLVQALLATQDSTKNLRLSVISSHTQPVLVTDEIAYEKSPMLGMIKTVSQELPWIDCRHIDLTAEQVEADAIDVLREIQVIQKEREVAYRDGQRFVVRLAKVDLGQEQKQELPFKRRGMYLLSGGLGEIGIEIGKYLLQHYEARLLLVGRTSLPDRSDWEEHLKQDDVVAKRIQAYLSLEQLAGEVIYQAVDICDSIELQQVVDQAKSYWQCELDGVIHLAGVAQERLLAEETQESLAATLRPKVLGTWVLHQLLQQQGKGIFISFSSVISVFGAFSVSAYAAANSFLDRFSHYQRVKSGLQSYCFGSSTWAGIGISRGYESRDARFAQGRQVMSLDQGLSSFLASLHYGPAHLLVALDGRHPYIRRRLESSFYNVQKLCAYFTISDAQFATAKLQELEVCDRFGTRSICDFRQLQQMPVTETGEIDRQQLSATSLKTTTDYVAPRTEVEEKLTSIWQQVLDVPQVGIYENFFELGGTSILAVHLFSKIEQTFGQKLPLSSLFPLGTVEALAEILSQTQDPTSNKRVWKHQQNTSKTLWSSLVEIQPKGSKPPLFCIHPLGGGVLCYRDLAIHLGLEQPVYGLQPLGLDGKQPPHTRMEDMAAHYIQEIQAFQPSGPYFLAGWSFGGMVAFEMAQQLHRHGEKVGLLGLIDSVRPGSDRRSPFLRRVLSHVNNLVKQGPGYLQKKAVGWSKHGKYHLQRRYKRYFYAQQYFLNVTKNFTDDEQNFVKVMNANVKALDEYKFQVYPGRITLLRTEDQHRDEAVGIQHDLLFGWGDFATGGIDMHYIPGSHLNLIAEPHVQLLAEKLKVCLERAYTSSSQNEEASTTPP